MTYDEMLKAVNDADPADKLSVAEAALAEYEGDDIELIAPMIYEMAAVDAE